MSQIYEALQQSTGKADANTFPVPNLAFAGDNIASDDISIEGLAQSPTFQLASTPERRLISWSDERGLGAEKIRILAAKLKTLQQTRQLKRVLITSSVKDEGKSLVSSNLAIALARPKQHRVLLVDGDCRRPSLAKLFGVSPSPALDDWWIQRVSITSCLRRLADLPLWFLSAGRPLSDPLEMLQSPRLPEAFAQLNNLFDWIVIDSPPFAPLADAGIWSSLSDGLLLVVRCGSTPKKVLAKVVDNIDRAKLLGAVLNDATDQAYGYYKHYFDSERG